MKSTYSVMLFAIETNLIESKSVFNDYLFSLIDNNYLILYEQWFQKL
jgi:hypothetical protein